MTHPMYSSNSFRMFYLHKPMTYPPLVADLLDDFTCWVLLRHKLVSCFGAQKFARHHPPYLDTFLHEDVTGKRIIIAIAKDYENVTN